MILVAVAAVVEALAAADAENEPADDDREASCHWAFLEDEVDPDTAAAAEDGMDAASVAVVVVVETVVEELAEGPEVVSKAVATEQEPSVQPFQLSSATLPMAVSAQMERIFQPCP